MHQLIETWRNFDTSRGGPYVLSEDKPILLDDRWMHRYSSWDEYSRDPNFGARDDGRFHLALLPVPFGGNLTKASVFILLLNPGFGPHDYFAEYMVPAFREAKISILRQPSRLQFTDLDPAFSWHGGFRYWHRRLTDLISDFRERNNLEYGEARWFFASQIAFVELVPYHSAHFMLPTKFLKQLHSVKLAQQFVHDVLGPRAKRNECVVIVTRSSKHWGLTRSRNVLLYDGPETRSAHLSPNSRGGKAILAFLQRIYEKRAA